MDISSQLQNVSLYDVKKYVRKAQNAVLNVTEMEAKVREATNNEPWATSTTVMQTIAEGTNNYQQFHEIMPFVYRRFTEKSANEWRQIYKSLQLLDFLVRNGSERVVDYARSHISVIEMLKHFSYIDSKGVDRGLSIRKRSEELVALLNSNKKLRAERKQAKQLNAKTFGGSGSAARYGGFSGSRSAGSSGFGTPTGVYANTEIYDAMGIGFGGSGSRFGGVGSDSYQQRQSGSRESLDADGDEFEEYEVSKKASKTSEDAKEEEDEFAEFQSAPNPAPANPASTNSILDLFDSPAPSTTAGPSLASLMSTPAPASSGFTSPMTTSSPFTTSSTFTTSAATPAPAASAPAASAPAASAPAASVDLFDSLWESSKTYTPATPTKPQPSAAQPAVLPALTAQPKPQSQPQPSKPQLQSQSGMVDLLDF